MSTVTETATPTSPVKSLKDETSAYDILKATSYFHDASDTLLKGLASCMNLYEVSKGYVFIEEGEPMTKILIVQDGTLVRTKLSFDTTSTNQKEEEFQLMKRRSLLNVDSSNYLYDYTNRIIVDEIAGYGHITGLFHNMKENNDQKEKSMSVAYATVSAKEDSTKVWILTGIDFRNIIASNPNHCFDVLHAMARELRTGSKSLQGLLQKVKKNQRSTTDGSSSASSTTTPTKVFKCLCYDTTSWVKDGFEPKIQEFNTKHTDFQIQMDYTIERLSETSAIYAAGYDAVCLFVNDDGNDKILQTLSLVGVQMIAMRCAGFDRIDTKAALAYGMTVVRVPAYSPYAVAEMAVSLLLSLNRKIPQASNRVKMSNFTLDAGLMGMDIYGKTVGIMGTGKIGQILVNIMLGFGAKVLCYDVYENDDVKKAGGIYVQTQDEIYTSSDIIFLMMPLLPSTKHTINDDVVQNKLKHGVLLINTSRGGLMDTNALIHGLQKGIIGGVGMDVYENEADYFFQDWSAKNITDPLLLTLLGDHNVVLTAHQAFFTKEAVTKIIDTTIENIQNFGQSNLSGFQHPNNCIPKN